MRIYVADLAAYNAGYLHGIHIDLAGADIDDVHAQIAAMLEAGTKAYGHETLSVHEEWAIHDYDETMISGLGEYETLESLIELARLEDEHGEPFAVFVCEVLGISDANGDLWEAERKFQDCFSGEYDDERDWAWSQFEELWPETYALVTDNPVPGVSFDPDDYVRESDEQIERSSTGGVFIFHTNY